jgi:hypothetical protein
MGTYSNEVYSWKDGKVASRTVYQGVDSRLNLSEMKTLTLADQWDRENNNHPIIISQCYAARASIGMAGHGSLIPNDLANAEPADKDFVYWEDNKTLRWNTYSKAYDLPKSIQDIDFYFFYNKNQINNSSNFVVKDRIEFIKKFNHFQASEIRFY